MALAPASLQCFLTGRPVCTATLPKLARRPSRISCKAAGDEKVPLGGDGLGVKLGKLAMVTLAAGVLALGPVDGAMAAKSGGRVGGQAFRSAPRSSGPRINNSRYLALLLITCLHRTPRFSSSRVQDRVQTR